MKKLILIATISITLFSCTDSVHTTYPLIVTAVESEFPPCDGFDSKYRVTLSSHSTGLFRCALYVFTDKKFSVGDTLH